MGRKLKPALIGSLLGAFFSALFHFLFALVVMETGPWEAAWFTGVLLPATLAAALICGPLVYFLASRPPFISSSHLPHKPLGSGSNLPRSRNGQGNAPSKSKRRRFPRLGMLARVSPSLKWVNVSPALRKFLNYPLRMLRQETLMEGVHPGDIALVEKAFQRARDREPGQPIQFRVFPHLNRSPGAADSIQGISPESQLPAGPSAATQKPLHVRMEVRACFRPNRDVRGFEVVLVDITDLARTEQALRKRSQEAARANEQLRKINQDLERLKESYRDLYHNAPVMFFSLDSEGRLVTSNETLLRRLGYQREELLNAPYHKLLAPPSAAEWQAKSATEKAQTLSSDREVETRWRTRTGTLLHVWVRSVPVVDEAGRFVRARAAALDLTERNRLANELRSRGDELERANARLRHINAELEDFTHVVSHDLKEPLRTLQAYSNILAQDFSTQLGPDGFESINHLNNASRRLGVLIDDLLQLSQAGRIAGKPQVFNLIEAVAVVRRDLMDLLQRKEATVLTEGSLPTIIGDQKRVTQLLTNLIANGLKYNRNPAPQVIIGTTAHPPLPPGVDRLENNQVVIFARDNGIGIDPAYHQQIFGIFRRLQPDEYEGTGAGLAICKKIVQAHGGHIWVDSRLGQGATFYFTLPRPHVDNGKARGAVPARSEAPDRQRRLTPLPPTRPAPTPPVPSVVAPAAPHPAARPEMGGTRILLVEDMEDVAVIVRRLAKRNGFHITWFTTAEDAWQYLQQNEPDFLLLDINLPGMKGDELCHKIRTELGRNGIPIALFTQDTPQAREKMRDSGASHLLVKDLLCQPLEWEKQVRDILLTAGVR